MAPTPALDSSFMIVKINVPSMKLQKSFKIQASDLIWNVNRMVADKVTQDIKDSLNFGLYLHGKDGKKGKFLDDRNTAGSYHLDNSSQLDFILKCKIGADPVDMKKAKKMIEDIRAGALDKLKEKTTKTTEFNFSIETGETPLSIATMNDDGDMVMWLMDSGAFLDFRSGEKDQWKTPLHLAAMNNKPNALKILIQFGAWVDAKDTLGLTPLYYAGSAGNSECVLRLLLARADTEVVDEHSRNVLHQAVMNNYDCIVGLLIDFGANMDQTNVGGNTPLHVAASRSCKESTKWLLLRGADTSKLNKSGKRPYECALQAACTEICEIMDKFTPEQIVIPPPRYIPESVTEYDGIVSNVLSALSSSIGKEYTPILYYTKPPATNNTYRRTMSPVKKIQSSPGNVDEPKAHLPEILPHQGSNKSLDPIIKGSAISKEQPKMKISEKAKELTSFDIAWRKIEPEKDPKTFLGLKNYIVEKKSSSETSPELNDLLAGIEEIEDGFLKAADEVTVLRQQNEELMQKLRELQKA